MERYLRFYIKLQGYIIAVMCLLASVGITAIIYQNNPSHYPLEEFHNYRYIGISTVIFGILWFGAGASMLYGVVKEVTVCLYPFAILFMLDLFLLFARDIVLIWQNAPYHQIILLNVAPGLIILGVTMQVFMTLLALGKLFEHEPPSASGTNFVWFKTKRQRSTADDVVLVTE